MYRVLEGFFRYPWRFLIILIVLPIIGVAITYLTVPRSYQSTARLWANHHLGTITPIGTDTAGAITPAQTQANTLIELLNTRSFALSVAAQTGLDATLKSQLVFDPNINNRQYLDDAIVANISKNVIVSVSTQQQTSNLSSNLYTITYTSTSPTVAQKVVASIITQFKIEGPKFVNANAKRLLQTYQTQLEEIKRTVDQDIQAQQNYLSYHPELIQAVNPANDPLYAALLGKREQDEQRMRDLQTNIDNINQQIGTGPNGPDFQNTLKEVDAPQVPYQSLPRLKQYIMGIGIALGVAILSCSIFLLILVRRDRTIYTSRDLEKLGNIPVIMGIPQLPAKMMKVLTERSA